MKPLFSVITVTFNAERFLPRTIESVLNQTYPDIEYIIVDGNSTDRTMDLVRQAVSASSRTIKVLCEPDKGLYDAMNKGLQMASGDYVWFLNAGDSFNNHLIVEAVAKEAQKNEFPDVLYGETDLVNLQGEIIAPRRLKAPKRLTWKSFCRGMLVCHQAFAIKRTITTPYNLEYRFSADFDWCIRCLKQSQSNCNTDLRLVKYLSEGLTTENRKASLKERYVIMCNYYGVVPTQLRHLWFAVRFFWAAIFKKHS